MVSHDPERSGEPKRSDPDPSGPESGMRPVRYRAGAAGESWRCVHMAVPEPGGLLVSACGRWFRPERMEQAAGGMPCVACVQALAAAERGEARQRLVDEHGEDGLPR
ncbi:hypothetical protein DFQ14_102576 [Halopolyspora algeriensis]|uniref:Uncharacterized protein n=1 Tax=Halopolyspora algeriensis TaxID=1500506 RepID=A0A368VWP4_9ACTN|nr:hypothetical protein [Halopolyspora algeriensis]RCW46273.1 hypothetical protein DFQ14_102576 [Halopolyspora algeriensis]TQM55675.1 hypothetical protein FHU43_0450 [Halopolyspora algeriensis]